MIIALKHLRFSWLPMLFLVLTAGSMLFIFFRKEMLYFAFFLFFFLFFIKNLYKRELLIFIQLLSPNIEISLAKKIISNSHRIIYFISQLSTTGSKLKVSPKRILKNYNKIKRMARGKFIILGFGITEKTIGKFKKSDAIVVGSACCKAITYAVNKKHSPAIKVGLMVKRLKNKIK